MTHDNASAQDVIEDIVHRARLPGKAAREDLRRELHSHFAEAALESCSLQDSVARFGSAEEVGDSLRHVYRWDFVVSYAARVALAFVAALVTFDCLMALVHLRISSSGDVRLLPEYFKVFGLGFKIAIALLAVWEIRRRPFDVRRAAAAFGVYWILVIALQIQVFGGLSGWEPWNIPIIVSIGVIGSQIRRISARSLLLFACFTVYFMWSRGSGPTPRPLIAVAHTFIWIVSEALFLRLDRAFASRLDVSVVPEHRSHGLA
jgi:hypothetical protein